MEKNQQEEFMDEILSHECGKSQDGEFSVDECIADEVENVAVEQGYHSTCEYTMIAHDIESGEEEKVFDYSGS